MSCFSSIQSKTFPSGFVDSISFCPSMDLVVVSNQILRYMVQQKLCNLSEIPDATAWNKRSIAIANGNIVKLYKIEELLAQSEEYCETLELPQKIVSLVWVSCGDFPHSEKYGTFHKYQKFYRNDSETLSLLCAMTSDGALHCFQNGVYPVLSGHATGYCDPRSISVSRDSSHIVVVGENAFSIYSLRFPPLPPDYSRVKKDLEQLSKALHPLLASYKSCLAPLDQKLDHLYQLFKNYGVERPIPECLNEYVWLGHSNIMDQFFTNVQMNDQLLVRLEASLSLVNVEKQVNSLLKLNLIPQLKSAQILRVLLEKLYYEVLKARQRIADWIKWLRSAGAAVRARGTAVDSVQRKNATLRRADDETTRQVRKYWSESHTSSSLKTENMLGLHVYQLLAPDEQSYQTSNGNSFPTLPYALEVVKNEVDAYFAAPAPRVHETTLKVPGRTAVTCRLGGSLKKILEPNCKQWLVSATVVENNRVAIAAIPLSFTERSVDLEVSSGLNTMGIIGNKGWTVSLDFSSESILDLGFYGDDGKSSLVPNTKEKEGRQKLGVLLEKNGEVELSIVNYDHLAFEPFDLGEGNSLSLDFKDVPTSIVQVERLGDDEENDEDPFTAYARSRVIGERPKNCRLVLNGARGVGAVLSHFERSTQVDILDLEDDDEMEE